MENTETQKQVSEDWRADVSDSSGSTLKVLDGETKQAIFLDEGKKEQVLIMELQLLLV